MYINFICYKVERSQHLIEKKSIFIIYLLYIFCHPLFLMNPLIHRTKNKYEEKAFHRLSLTVWQSIFFSSSTRIISSQQIETTWWSGLTCKRERGNVPSMCSRRIQAVAARSAAQPSIVLPHSMNVNIDQISHFNDILMRNESGVYTQRRDTSL